MLNATTVLLYLLVVLAGAWCWFQVRFRELLRAASKLPVTHPKWPILGHSYFAFGGIEGLSQAVLDLSMRAVASNLKTVVFWCGPLPIIAIHDVEDIQTVLNSSNTLDKAEEYEYFKNGIDSGVGPSGYSILSAPGNIWKVTRRFLNPLFHHRNIKHLVPLFNKNSRALVTSLSEHVGTGPVEVMDYTMNVSLKTICDLVFGPSIDIDIRSKEFHGLKTVVEKIPEFFITRLLRPWLRIEMVFNFLYAKELSKLNSLLKDFTEIPLKKAKESARQKQLSGSINTDTSKSNETEDGDQLNIVEVYNVLQQSFPQFTEAGLRYEITTLYGTGSDTVGATTASCLLALAQYQDIQEKLHKEVSSVVGFDDDVTLEDLNRMPYLDQVIKESLRRFTIVPFILRKATTDMKLSTTTIPAGNTIVVSLAGIHMDPNTYPDPLKFDPDRFSISSQSRRKASSAFMPFSGGPRNCIAKTYAMQFMKIMIVHVVRRFKLTTNMNIHNLKKKLMVTLVSAEGYNISLENRNLFTME